MVLTRMSLVLLLVQKLAFSSAACNVTSSWSIIGDEFNLKHFICNEIPANGEFKIAVPTGFDLSNSDIIKQTPEGWTLTESGTTQIKLKTSKTTSANTLIEITLSKAKAPAHYIAPFQEKFTEFSSVVTKQDFDCAQCTAATATPAGPPPPPTPVITPLLYEIKFMSQSNSLEGKWENLTSDTKDADVEGLNLQGVTIEGGMLTGLELNIGLKGTIPDFSKNTALRVLHLDDNVLTGSIPDFSNNTALEELCLQTNTLNGSLPDFSKNLNLTTIKLNGMALSGEIGDFSNNVKLTHLYLYQNAFTGAIPDFSNNVALEKLYLFGQVGNGFTGIQAWSSNADNKPAGLMPCSESLLGKCPA